MGRVVPLREVPLATDPHRQALHLFRECLTLDPEERAAFLEERCAGDVSIRAEVESLLAHHDTRGGILDRDPDLEALGLSLPERPADPARALEGKTVGAYRILELLGHGGMGAVYLAEQSEPVRRRVALKILRDPTGSRDILARFASERQALALMDHPNIARIFDADQADDGRPFFTMEYVPGVPLLEFCEQQQLDLEATLTLFRAVCSGVQHAHQKGVIHRDLKPSNILVTVRGGVPIPKIIDFGVAKALHHPLTDLTLHTAHGYLVGTPAYMSPEQCLGDGRDIDTRADVYSLGALLYEMLAGTVPLALRGVGTAGVAEFQRMLMEEEPPAVSARIERDPQAREALAARGQDPARWRRRCRGELDWIVQRALAKERTRRYETVNGLAADVGRFLDREPVSAGPPGVGYRLRTVARRHRALLTSAVLVAVVLLVASAISVRFAVQSHLDRRAAVASQAEAVRLRQEAELSAAEALRAERTMRGALDYFVDLMQHSIPQGGGTDSLTVRDALRGASETVDGLMSADPDVGAVVASNVGQFHWVLAEPDLAEPPLRQALLHLRENPDLAPEEYGSVAKLLGLVERDRGNLAVATRLFEESYRAYQGFDPNHWDLPMVRDLQASVLEREGRSDEALALRREILTDHPEPTGRLALNVASVHNKVASQEMGLGNLDEAERHLLRSLRLVGPAPEHAYYRGGAWARLGSLARERSQPREALDWFLKARSALALEPAHPFQRRLNQDIVEARLALDDLDGAARELREVEAVTPLDAPDRPRIEALWAQLQEKQENPGGG